LLAALSAPRLPLRAVATAIQDAWVSLSAVLLAELLDYSDCNGLSETGQTLPDAVYLAIDTGVALAHSSQRFDELSRRRATASPHAEGQRMRVGAIGESLPSPSVRFDHGQ
jgi:hypothetical protein